VEISSILLTNYRNYTSSKVDEFEKINLILGSNGEGKTNFIDAVHYLCFGKSYFSSTDQKILKWESDFFRIEGKIKDHKEDYKITAKIVPGKLKEITINGKKLDKLANMVGRFPIIAISPKEVYRLLQTSEARRKIIDQVMAQFDKSYLTHLIKYNSILQRRNALLKRAERFNHLDLTLIEMINDQLAEHAKSIFKKRKEFLNDLIPIFESYYQSICSEKEQGNIIYKSQLETEDFKLLLEQSLEKDFYLKRTSVGIHKDDYVFYLNGHPLKSFGSQGQLKTYVIALKFALYSLLKKNRTTIPILLLDDIFDKFDTSRTTALVKMIFSDNFGQVFITDADAVRMPKVLEDLKIPFKRYMVEKGNIL